MNKKFQILIGLPKSLYINFKYFKFLDAIKLPILVSHRTKFLKLKGKVSIQNTKIKTGMIKIGLEGAGTSLYEKSILEFNGNLIFHGCASFGGGCKLCTVNSKSILDIGKNFNCVGDCHIVCKNKILIKNDVRISWNVQIMDSDFHNIYNEENELINKDANVLIGDNVWICSKSIILKGSNIPDNNVLGSGTIYSKNIEEENCIIAGIPAKIIKRNIIWKP